MVCGYDGVEGELEAYATRTLYLPELKVNFTTRNGGIFMFHVNKVLYYKMKNKNGNQYGVAFVQKTSMFKYLMNLND
jgi:hypothetical protein